MIRSAITTSIILLLGFGRAGAGDETKTEETAKKPPPPVEVAFNKVFKGKVVKFKKGKVTLYYDFEDEKQLEDFEEVRPPRLLNAVKNQVEIRGGKLYLEGSSAIRHKMEGKGEMRARFQMRCFAKRDMGTIFTEPILSEYFIILTLFDNKFNEDGELLLAACGLHEDEGADVDYSLANYRDLFRTKVSNKIKMGEEFQVEVAKNGWKEYCKVGEKEGKGISKGKCRWMENLQFGFFVHESRASFDDLYLTVELTEEFLKLNNLKGEVVKEPDSVAETGPLAGVKDVPPAVRKDIEAYADGKGDPLKVIAAIERTGLPAKAREAAARVLMDRKDPKVVPLLINTLYAKDKTTRKLAIDVVKAIVGKNFGYRPGSSEKTRSKAIQKLNKHLNKNRAKFYG